MISFNQFHTDLNSRDIYLEQGIITTNVHPTLAESWQRSTRFNIDPHISAAPKAKANHKSPYDQLLLDCAKPYFKYFNHLLRNESVLVLANPQGVLLHMAAGSISAENKKLTEKHNFLVDASWHEQSVGTNAIGMAITEKANIFMAGFEHYVYTWHPYACAAAPIINKNTGAIMGAINITSFNGELNLHSLGWVAALAKLMEKDLYHQLNHHRLDDTTSPINHYITIPMQQIPGPQTNLNIVGNSPALVAVLKDATKMAKSPLNICITGETGTGKEILAKYIHNCSNRHHGPFVAVNCGAIPKELVASELFGYTDGAFTGAARRGRKGYFELAHQGTLFLDEIGDAPYDVQIGLLRVLEEKKLYPLGAEKPIDIDVKVITATSLDLFQLMEKKLFRQDLYYRLAGMILEAPSLRERGQDIISLAEYYLQQFNTTTQQQLIFDERLKKLFLGYHWPGNIRELKNIVQRMATLADNSIIYPDLFYKCLPQAKTQQHTLGDAEKTKLIYALEQTQGNITQAAKLLDIDRTTVYRRMKKHGLGRNTISL